MRPALALALVCVFLASVGVASAGGPPLVDAGLDQHVAVGALVYLDVGGTVAPYGRVVWYQWTVRGPDGTPVRVRCAQCQRTVFRPIDPTSTPSRSPSPARTARRPPTPSPSSSVPRPARAPAAAGQPLRSRSPDRRASGRARRGPIARE